MHFSSNAKVSEVPKYWNLMNNIDQYQYMYMRNMLANPTNKSLRNKRLENFSEMLEVLRQFCVRGDGEDWRRFLVTGIAWLKNGAIAVNTHQLKLITNKCKSSINGSLHKMGFNYGMERSEAAAAVVQSIPILKENPAQLRQWTVRSNIPMTPMSSPPSQSPINSPVQQVPIEIVGVTEQAPQEQTVFAADQHEATEFDDSCCFESSFTDQLDFGFDASFDSCLW